jgi:hypothetical protein
MKIKHALNTAAIAIALAFSGASHASTDGDAYNHQVQDPSGGLLVDLGAKLINPEPGFPFPAVSVSVYEMTNATDYRQTFLAYCFQPDVALGQFSTYSATYNVGAGVVSNSVRALYETAYESTLGNADKQFAFQLALWELQADDGKLYATTGAQYFTAGGDARVADAADMLETASHVTTLNGTYLYTIFTGVNPDNSASQTLIGVAPVPEADAWAMLAAGLGLIGLMGRRKSRQSEKFAA